MSDVLYLSNLTCRSSVSVGANDRLQVASLPSQQAGRSIVATSTNYTQLLGPEAMERSGHPYLLQLIQWSQQADHVLLQGYPSLWRWSLDFSLYRSMFSETVTPLRECQHVLQGLRFQQLRSVLVQAFVAEIVVHPAGMRAVQDGRMDQPQYDAALRHLALTAPVADGQDAAAAAAEKPAAAVAPRGKKGRARFAQSAEGEASAAEISASQSSTVSSRLRRSARSQTVGDTRSAETAAASSRAASETRSGRSRTRGAAQEGAQEGEGEEEAGRRRASSADIGTPVKRRGKLVKIVQRRLKRKERPEGEDETAAAAAAAASVAAPSPAVAVAAVSSSLSFFAGSSSGIVNGSSPSSPSTLCTLLLRDLNGEFDLCVQLQDPVLGHVSFDRAVGSIHAAGYETPPAAPRVRTTHRTRVHLADARMSHCHTSSVG